MKIKGLGLFCLAASGILLIAAHAMAQQAGFQIAIGPAFAPQVIVPTFGQPFVVFPGHAGLGPFGFPPTQAPAIVRQPQFVPTSPFAFNPYGSYAFPAPQVVVPSPVFIVAPGQILIPNQVLVAGSVSTFGVPGQVFIPTQVLVPGQMIFPGAVISQAPPARFVSGGPPIVGVAPPIGTPRAEVLLQLGQPAVSVITRNGETLHFSGGLTVFIQNGQVAGPR